MLRIFETMDLPLVLLSIPILVSQHGALGFVGNKFSTKAILLTVTGTHVCVRKLSRLHRRVRQGGTNQVQV